MTKYKSTERGKNPRVPTEIEGVHLPVFRSIEDVIKFARRLVKWHCEGKISDRGLGALNGTLQVIMRGLGSRGATVAKAVEPGAVLFTQDIVDMPTELRDALVAWVESRRGKTP